MPDVLTLVDTLGRRPAASGAPGCRFEDKDPGRAALEPRSAVEAVRRGLAGRCPRCGCTRLFRSFLQPVPVCPACGQDWRTRTADDFPPYLVILLVGHIVAPAMIALESGWHPPLWLHLILWPPLVLLLGLLLIQPMKGAVIAVQWWHWDRVNVAGPPAKDGGPDDGATLP